MRFNGRSALWHFWCQILPNWDFITDNAVNRAGSLLIITQQKTSLKHFIIFECWFWQVSALNISWPQEMPRVFWPSNFSGRKFQVFANGPTMLNLHRFNPSRLPHVRSIMITCSQEQSVKIGKPPEKLGPVRSCPDWVVRHVVSSANQCSPRYCCRICLLHLSNLKLRKFQVNLILTYFDLFALQVAASHVPRNQQCCLCAGVGVQINGWMPMFPNASLLQDRLALAKIWDALSCHKPTCTARHIGVSWQTNTFTWTAAYLSLGRNH